MSLEEIVKTIQKMPHAAKPILIGIEGFGGSGKTTVADILAGRLGDAYVVHIDDFIVKEKITDPSWDTGGFDRKRLEEQVLKPATSGRAITYQKLIWQSNTLSDYVTIPQSKYLIVEGISSYHPDIRDYYDYTLWVDTPMAIAKERGHARDGSNENADHWDLWTENDRRYQQKYHPEQAADFMYSNEARR